MRDLCLPTPHRAVCQVVPRPLEMAYYCTQIAIYMCTQTIYKLRSRSLYRDHA